MTAIAAADTMTRVSSWSALFFLAVLIVVFIAGSYVSGPKRGRGRKR